MIRTSNVEDAWEGDTIATPAPTVGGEKVGLGRTRGPIRKGEVIAATNKSSVSGAGILGGEVRVLVG